MKLNIKTMLFLFLCLFPKVSISAPSINELHSCLGMVEFVYMKVTRAKSLYSEKDIKSIKEGLKGYGLYLRNDIIAPTILDMYGGNESQAKLMHSLFKKQKAKFIGYLNDRYLTNRMQLGYVEAIKDCALKTPPSNGILNKLNNALSLMAGLATK